MKDGYDWWHKALAGYKVGGPDLPVHDGVPQPGRYRKRTSKSGGFEPVAIFPQNGKMTALVGFKSNERVEDADNIWTYCCRHPIAADVYTEAMVTGAWPDVDEAVTASIGHNEAPDDDAIRDQIEAVSESVSLYETVSSEEEAAKAQSVRSRLLECSKDADKKRKDQKEPHLQAGRDVDLQWLPLVRLAKAGADMIAKAIGKFKTEQACIEREALRKAETAERKAREAAEKAALAGKPAPSAPERVYVPPPSTQVRPGYGRAASVRDIKVLDEATIDWHELVGFYQGNHEVTDLLRKLATRDLNKGIEVPGVKYTIEKKVI